MTLALGSSSCPLPPASRVAFATLGGLLLIAATALRSEAGAWTQPVGGYYGRIGFAGIDTHARFDGSGDRVAYQTSGTIARDAEYRSRELRGYGEYGVLERLTLYGSLSYKRLAVEEQAALHETNGPGDLYLGARGRLTRGGPPLSIAGEVKLATGYSTDENPSLGAGQSDATIKVLSGLSGARWYATGDLGWTHRAGSFQNQLVSSLEAGGRAGSRLGGRAVLRWARSIGELRALPAGGFDPALASPRMLVLDGAVSADVGANVSLELAVSSTLSGNNSLAGNTLEIAVVRSGSLGRAR